MKLFPLFRRNKMTAEEREIQTLNEAADNRARFGPQVAYEPYQGVPEPYRTALLDSLKGTSYEGMVFGPNNIAANAITTKSINGEMIQTQKLRRRL